MPDTGNPADAPKLLIATVTSYNERRQLGKAVAVINHKPVQIDFRMKNHQEVIWDEEHLSLTITDDPADDSQPFLMFETPLALRAERRGRLLHAVTWGFVPRASLAIVAPALAAQANLPELMTG